MKRIFSLLICFLLVIGCLTGCKDEPEIYSEWISIIEIVEDDEENTSEDKTDTSSEQEGGDSEEGAEAEKIKFESTVIAPTTVTFYKNGMKYTSESEDLNLKIAKHIEEWFYDYETDTLPAVDMEVTPQFIWETRLNETAIEIDLGLPYGENLNFLGKINLEHYERLFIPLTGEYAYYLFSDKGDVEHQNKPFNLKGSGLEQYFEGITPDNTVRDWQSTVIAPTTVTFYKDGASTVSTDKELNHKIAKHIEDWFKYKETGMGANLSADTDTLRPIRQNEMAVELQFDDEIKFHGYTEFKNSRTIFIPVTGKYKNMVFNNRIDDLDDWSGPIYGGGGLEQYFDYVQFTPLTEEEKRWRSTVSSAGNIKAYEGETLLGASDGYKDYTFNYEVMQRIEKWFYHKEEIKRVDTGITDVNLGEIRAKEKYLEIWLGSPETTFYGKYIISEKSGYILIPLTGEYAYHIFEGDYKNYSPTAIVTEGSGLEQYFEDIKAKGTVNEEASVDYDETLDTEIEYD